VTRRVPHLTADDGDAVAAGVGETFATARQHEFRGLTAHAPLRNIRQAAGVTLLLLHLLFVHSVSAALLHDLVALHRRKCCSPAHDKKLPWPIVIINGGNSGNGPRVLQPPLQQRPHSILRRVDLHAGQVLLSAENVVATPDGDHEASTDRNNTGPRARDSQRSYFCPSVLLGVVYLARAKGLHRRHRRSRIRS
jgi:hypothetical protein